MQKVISIHVPTRGTTRRGQLWRERNRNFNPRPHEGDDWGIRPAGAVHCRFQSTSPRGGRPYIPLYTSDWLMNFNPRPHEGDDKDDFAVFILSHDFNPRPHEGDDEHKTKDITKDY